MIAVMIVAVAASVAAMFVIEEAGTPLGREHLRRQLAHRTARLRRYVRNRRTF